MSTSSESLCYRVRRSGIHRRGLFAARDIQKGTRVIEYVGERITKAESQRRAVRTIERAAKTGGGAVYIFELNKRTDIDGNVATNFARLINHSCQANCETEIIRGKIWIIAVRNIKQGEEFSYDYGYDLDHYEEHPCRCGSRNCVGYIVAKDQRRRLRRILANQS